MTRISTASGSERPLAESPLATARGTEKNQTAMKLQLALDTPDLTHELELAGKVAAYVDLIEAGTPLLIREGIRAVRELRRRTAGVRLSPTSK